MPDWTKLLAQHGPKLALGLLAAKQGGPQSVAAFMEGLQQGEMQRYQRGMDAQQMDIQSQRNARADEAQQAQLANMEKDNQRQQQAFEMQKFERALGLMQATGQQQAETAVDPIQAENALKQTAQSAAGAYGLAPDALTGFIPNMGPAISQRKKRQAQTLYERAEKTYGQEAMATDSVTIQTGELFGDVKPSQLRAMFESPAVDAAGAPAKPYIGKASAPTAGSFEEYVNAPPERQAVIEGARKRYQQADDKPAGTGGPSSRFWVMRNGKLIRITEAEYQPGDQPAATREQGRAVTAGDAADIAELNTSLDDLNTLERQLGQTGAASKVGAMLPNVVTEFTGWGESAKQRQAVIDRVKQVIGKALEGGVLRKEDEYKYVKILPTIGDPPEVARTKIAGLRTAITQRRGRRLETLGQSGFDTSKFDTAPTSGAISDPASDPLGLFK